MKEKQPVYTSVGEEAWLVSNMLSNIDYAKDKHPLYAEGKYQALGVPSHSILSRIERIG